MAPFSKPTLGLTLSRKVINVERKRTKLPHTYIIVIISLSSIFVIVNCAALPTAVTVTVFMIVLCHLLLKKLFNYHPVTHHI